MLIPSKEDNICWALRTKSYTVSINMVWFVKLLVATTQDPGPYSKEGRLVLKNFCSWNYQSDNCKC
jgi:phage-related protein